MVSQFVSLIFVNEVYKNVAICKLFMEHRQQNNYVQIWIIFMETTHSACVSIGSTGSLEHMEFLRMVPKPMDFE